MHNLALREWLYPGEPKGDPSRPSASAYCHHFDFHAECGHCVAAEQAAVARKPKRRSSARAKKSKSSRRTPTGGREP